MGSKPIPVATATNVSATKLSSSSATSQVKSEVVQDIKPDKVIGNANDFIYDLKELVKIHVDKFIDSVVENKRARCLALKIKVFYILISYLKLIKGVFN